MKAVFIFLFFVLLYVVVNAVYMLIPCEFFMTCLENNYSYVCTFLLNVKPSLLKNIKNNSSISTLISLKKVFVKLPHLFDLCNEQVKYDMLLQLDMTDFVLNPLYNFSDKFIDFDNENITLLKKFRWKTESPTVEDLDMYKNDIYILNFFNKH